jgi:hypothetical protein
MMRIGTMKIVDGLKCIFSTASGEWSVALVFADGEEKRFVVAGPEHIDSMLDAFEDASETMFDAETGEIIFAYEYVSAEDLMDEDDDEDEDEDDVLDDEDDQDDEDKGGSTPPTGKHGTN